MYATQQARIAFVLDARYAKQTTAIAPANSNADVR
jgi:hypothetical protein